MDVSSHSAGCGCEANAGDSMTPKTNKNSPNNIPLKQGNFEIQNSKHLHSNSRAKCGRSSDSAGCGCKANAGDSIQQKRQKRNSIKTRINTNILYNILILYLLYIPLKQGLTP